MPRGRAPVLIQAAEVAQIVGWTVDHFHRAWREVPALVDACYEGNLEGSPRQWVKSKVQAFKAAKKLLGTTPVRAHAEEDDQVLRLAAALDTVVEIVTGEAICCAGCRQKAATAVLELRKGREAVSA